MTRLLSRPELGRLQALQRVVGFLRGLKLQIPDATADDVASMPAVIAALETYRRALESAGVRLQIAGLEHVAALEGPCVFIGNHMSTLETFVLPVILLPFKQITFVVKRSLVEYPVFGHVMRSRNPITVGRTNPREDLKAVLEGGVERLGGGISLVIFPQTTRVPQFDPKEFNTIGVKLAKKADVPVIPLALKTDAWGNGRLVKDIGRLDPSKTAHFTFGAPMRVQDRGGEEHERIIFIREAQGVGRVGQGINRNASP
jgi:1-acyl-sn-glycerol-3-phosphate acyltransferase